MYFACISVYAPHICSTHRGQKRALDSLGIHYCEVLVGAGNPTWSSGETARALIHWANFPATIGFQKL